MAFSFYVYFSILKGCKIRIYDLTDFIQSDRDKNAGIR